MKLFAILLWAFAPLIHQAWAQQPTIIEQTDTDGCRRWVDSVYNTLTERQRVAQLIFPKADPTGAAVSKSRLRTLVKENGVGGLLFSQGSIEQYIDMTNYAQSIAEVPVLMTFDGEWGLSMRIKKTPRFPHNMALGAIRDDRLLYDYGLEMARECRLMGVQVNFAPDVDVNSNPANPVIGFRSFGEDPERVSTLALAYSRGLEDGGVQSVAKHFPGHGDTSTDSHKTLPMVGHTLGRLDSIDLYPFKKYIGAGLSGVMVGHLAVPSLDPSGKPASLSNTIMTGLLKDKLGFKGLVYTDALAMHGADMKGSNCVAALMAGADVLLCPSNPVDEIDAVMAAVRSGKVARSEIESRCRKVLAYKYALGLSSRPAPVSMAGMEAALNSPEADAVLRSLAAASMTVVRNDAGLLPIGGLADNSIAVVNIGGKDGVFGKFCRKYADVEIYNVNDGHIPAATLSRIKAHNTLIVAVYSDSQASRNAFASLKDAKGLVPVFFMNPYRMAKFKPSLDGCRTLVLAYDDTPYQREYAAQAIFGGIDVDGSLPVNLRGIAPIGTGVRIQKTRLGYTSPMSEGMDPDVSRRVDSLISVGLKTKAFPGGQLLVAKNGNVVIDKNFGTIDYISKTPVTDRTIYDLASVSKATGTLPGVMKAYDLGLFDLDAPVERYVPGLRGKGKSDITVRELLYHQSGMPASLQVMSVVVDTASYSGKLTSRRPDESHTIKIGRNVYAHKDARLRADLVSVGRSLKFDMPVAEGLYVGRHTYDTIMNRIYSIDRRPNKKYLYSCLNFCLLMDMEQRLTGIGHDRWVKDSIFSPLGAGSLTYRPLESFGKENVAPTEKDLFLRRQTVCGYVHDETAAFSGGVQGNAGLFGNAGDLAKVCQMWLNGGRYGDARVLSEPTVRLFTTDHSSVSRRGLGFDKPDMENPESSPTCAGAPASAYGHLGFTGTVFWVDPDNEIIFIFLNNRVNPTRDNPAFSKLDPRPALFQMVYDAIGED